MATAVKEDAPELMAFDETDHEDGAHHSSDCEDSDSNMLRVDDGASDDNEEDGAKSLGSAVEGGLLAGAVATAGKQPYLVVPGEDEQDAAVARAVAMLNDNESFLMTYCGHLPPNEQLSQRHQEELARDYAPYGISQKDLEVTEKKAAMQKRLSEVADEVWADLVAQHGAEKYPGHRPRVSYARPRWYTTPLTTRPIPMAREVRHYARGDGVLYWSVTAKSSEEINGVSAAPAQGGDQARKNIHIIQHRKISVKQRPDPKKPGSTLTKASVVCIHDLAPNTCITCNQRNMDVSTNPDERLLETARVRRCPICTVDNGPCPHPMAVPSPISRNMIPAGRICIWNCANLTITRLLVCKSSAAGRHSVYFCLHHANPTQCKICRGFFAALIKRCRSGGEYTRPFLEAAAEGGRKKKKAAKDTAASVNGDPIAFYGDRYVAMSNGQTSGGVKSAGKGKNAMSKRARKRPASQDRDDPEGLEDVTLSDALSDKLDDIYGSSGWGDEEEEEEDYGYEEKEEDDEEEEEEEDEEVDEDGEEAYKRGKSIDKEKRRDPVEDNSHGNSPTENRRGGVMYREQTPNVAFHQAQALPDPLANGLSPSAALLASFRDPANGGDHRLAGNKRPASEALDSADCMLVTTVVKTLRENELRRLTTQNSFDCNAAKRRLVLLGNLIEEYSRLM